MGNPRRIRPAVPSEQLYLSGYVCEDSGETLINVTVLDLNTLKGTLSNEHGFSVSRCRKGNTNFVSLI